MTTADPRPKPLLDAMLEEFVALAAAVVDEKTNDDRVGVRRPNQLPPPGDWLIWLMRPGRGWGKTYAASRWALDRIEAGYKQIAMVGATAGDVRDIMVTNPKSGLIALAAPHLRATYKPSQARVDFSTGASVKLYSAEKPDRARGPEHDTIICDELDGWAGVTSTKKATDMLNNLLLGLRIGDDPRMLCTSTPKPGRLVASLVKRSKDRGDVVVVGGSSYENKQNLSPRFLEEIAEAYEGTRLGRQEIHGEILEDVLGALWTRAALDETRVRDLPDVSRSVVAIDPAATAKNTSDETGICGASLGVDGHAYVTDDWSCRMSPLGWARRAVELYDYTDASMIVAEANQGGDMVRQVIQQADPNVPVKLVSATRSKMARAEPVAMLWEQGKAHIVGNDLQLLEDQMANSSTTGYVGAESPDRLDAMVYAVAELTMRSGPELMIGRA